MKKILWKIESIWEEESNLLHAQSQPLAPAHAWPNASRYFTLAPKPLLAPSLAPAYRDDYGEYYGLAEASVMAGTTPIYIMDNHNRALFAFLEIKEALYLIIGGNSIDIVGLHISLNNSCLSLIFHCIVLFG